VTAMQSLFVSFLNFLILGLVSFNTHAHETCSMPMSTALKKESLVERLLDAKAASGLTFDEIAASIGVTNAYAAQLFTAQAQLKPATTEKLKAIVPAISDEDLAQLQKVPMRSFDPVMLQDPFIYRLIEAMQHYGLGLKLLVNEKKGDGIMSAIDMYASMDILKGVMGEDRVVITLNGKFLPHVEQLVENNTAQLQK
jgi:cyanate lyase